MNLFWYTVLIGFVFFGLGTQIDSFGSSDKDDSKKDAHRNNERL